MDIDINSVLAWGLAGFFFIGATVNFRGSQAIKKDYERWGYPVWFNLITGALEFIAATLLLFSPFRLPGALLASAIMAAAVLTVLFWKEYNRLAAPALTLLVAAICVSTSI